MGNKIGSRKKSSSSDGPKKSEVKRRQKKNEVNSSNSNRDKKIISCPDLSGAVPYKFEDDDARVDVQIYRSYSNVSENPAEKRQNFLSEQAPDIRVYRRSTGHLQHAGAPDKSQTLPRSFGRSRSAVTSLQAHQQQKQQINGTLPSDRRSVGGGGGGGGGGGRRSTLGGYSFSETKGSKRTLSTTSMNSIGYKVNPDDFPDTSTIKRKLNLFETTFVRTLTEVFSSGLSETVQLSLLSIAIRPDRANQQVSLWQFLQSNDVPVNLLEQTTNDHPDYVLTIPKVLYEEIYRIRRENITDLSTWTAVAKQILTCQAMEAANELSRVFEYQLSLMPEGLPMELLGRHSAQCVHEFLKRNNRSLDRNSIVQGVVRGHLKAPDVCPKFSIIIGERELKWNLFEIFKKPGLRKELFLLSGNIQTEVDEAPWKYFTSLRADPMLYGYRGLIVDWDFASFSYQLSGDDEASFPDEVDWRPDDFHRDYCPYRRLVGLGVMCDFCAMATSKETAFWEFVKKIQGRAYSRDRIQPVYRPLGDGAGLRDQLPLDDVNLDNADTLRLRKSKTKPKSPIRMTGIDLQDNTTDKAVVVVAIAKKTSTSSGSSEVSPRRIGTKESPASTITVSAHSSRSNIQSDTGSPNGTGFRRYDLNVSTPVDSNDSCHGDTSINRTTDPAGQRSPYFGQAVTIRCPYVEEGEMERSAEKSAIGADVDRDFIQVPRSPTHTPATVSRRSTITSDV